MRRYMMNVVSSYLGTVLLFSIFLLFFPAKEGNGHYWRKKEGKKKEKKEIVKNLEKCDKIVL